MNTWFRAKEELHLVYVDMKKAYDSVSHTALLQVLQGTNKQFVQLITNLYQSQVKLKINRELTSSMMALTLLFIIFLVPMIKWIESSKDNGYEFACKFSLPLLAYCDDIVLLGKSFSDINSVFDKLVQYYAFHNLGLTRPNLGTPVIVVTVGRISGTEGCPSPSLNPTSTISTWASGSVSPSIGRLKWLQWSAKCKRCLLQSRKSGSCPTRWLPS